MMDGPGSLGFPPFVSAFSHSVLTDAGSSRPTFSKTSLSQLVHPVSVKEKA